MLSWLWVTAAGPPAPPVSPALRDAQDLLGSTIVARLRNPALTPFPDDRALAAACGFDIDRAPALARHLGAAVRSYGGEHEEKAIMGDAVVIAAGEASRSPPRFAAAVLASGTAVIPLDQVEAMLRDCLSLVAVPGGGKGDDGGDDSAVLARALAAGAAEPGDLGGDPSSSSSSPASSSSTPPSHIARERLEKWAKQRAGVAVADFLAGLMLLRLTSDPAASSSLPPPWPNPPPRLLAVPAAPSSPSPLLLSPRAALLLAPHVADPRRRERWRLVYSAALHGKSWSTLQGRLSSAGATAAANIEAHAEAAALAAFNAGGGGEGGAGAGRGRAARAAAAAAAVASAPRSSSAAAAAAAAYDDESGGGGWVGPPATLVLARDAASGAVFGGAASAPWRKRPDFYGGGGGGGSSSGAFLLALNPRVRVHALSGINTNVQYLGSGFQSRPNGLGMGGSIGAFGFWIDASLEAGHSRPNATFACAPLLAPRPEQEFRVSDVEVWALLTPEEDEGPPGAAGAGRGAGAGAGAAAGVLGAANAEARGFLQVAGKFADHSAGVRD